MKLKLLDRGEWTRAEVEDSIRDIINSNRLLSMASVDGEKPHINTCFYCFDEELHLYILTPPDTVHGENLKKNDSVAVDIHDSHQSWSDEKQGLQIFGKARKVDEKEKILETYTERYPDLKDIAPDVEGLEKLDSVFYRIDIEKVKVFDEQRFGKETWIEVSFE